MFLAGIWDRTVRWLFEHVLRPVGVRYADVTGLLVKIPQFFAVLLLFYLIARTLVWVLSKTLLREERGVAPMLAGLVNKLLYAVLMFIGFAVSLLVFDVNIFDIAITLGLVGAALALGLQNTVANIMGGISLVSDRPFEVGDRVQIGDFWGDVEAIGLRSTRILTARREYVVVPNRLMDEREIWNYTKRYPELRLEIDVQISYDSDIDLARQLMLEAAQAHPSVLAFPEPTALAHGFHDSGVVMQLRCFISDARQQYDLASEIRTQVKQNFQDNGVEIPYPYRTLVEKGDLPEPASYEGPRSAGDRLGPRRVLVASAGATPAVRKAETVVDICKELDADIVLTHIAPRSSIVEERDGERAADIYQSRAEPEGVGVQLVFEEGGIVDAIRRVADRQACGAVVIGGSPTPVLRAWRRAGIEERVRRSVDVPVIVVSPDVTVDRDEVEAARRSLDSIEAEGAPP